MYGVLLYPLTFIFIIPCTRQLASAVQSVILPLINRCLIQWILVWTATASSLFLQIVTHVIINLRIHC